MQPNRYKKIIKNKLSYLRNHKSAVLTVITLFTVGDIFSSNIKSDFITFGILGSYVCSIFLYQLKSKTTFSICFFVLATFIIQFIFSNTSNHTEKAAVWLFLFMGLGIFQEILSAKQKT